MGVPVSKIMDTTPLGRLLGRMVGEYRAKGSIYEIPEKLFRESFELEAASPGLEVMGTRVSLPVGPAAGPHSQIAPNLVAAYLAGARVFELKTVQENDSLDIEKPCIDAHDEGHNVEWSTELSLTAAREEYLRGWIAINLLGALFSAKPREFVFNMSVGYTLAGIKTAKVDAYIEGMRRPTRSPFWKQSLDELAAIVDAPEFAAAFGTPALARARSLLADFPASPIHSVTLSTMHGCPPDEIERIGAYLIEEKGFDTFVKLNPTLLGYDTAREILDSTGWKDIGLKRDTFEHDLQFKDALALIAALGACADADGKRFGIKLSNTLANANDGSFLPGGERYMSGRALFPITVRLAAELAAALPGFGHRFSYCGGVSALNAGDLVSAGMGPLTVATDILKPGGYLRLSAIARAAVRAIPGSPDRADAEALDRLAGSALAKPEYRREWKTGAGSIKRKLPLFDCFAAPCVEACPVSQKVPEYIRLSASGASKEALAAILADNPLPFITGTLCDHVCQEACNRNDYEGSVEIRGVKLACAKAASIPAAKAPRNPAFRGKVAVIGAGPAGLSCAHHLAVAGVEVTVFDKAAAPGGVPANVIPHFRIPREDLARDIERIRSLGVEFRFGTEVRDLALLKTEGYTQFFVCAGAPVPRDMPLAGSGVEVVDALDFLATCTTEPSRYAAVRNIVVAGGGNTAMDAVRASTRLPGTRSVRLSYRRSLAEMPADKEELHNALAEGAVTNATGAGGVPVLVELSLPERAEKGRLELRLMELGERDASGRRSPKPSARTTTVDCDLLVAAVGESPDTALLAALGIECGKDGRPVHDPQSQATGSGIYVGGDAARGPASIITAAADGRRAAYAMLRAAGIEPPASAYLPPAPDRNKLAARGELSLPLSSADRGFVAREAERCLACDSACLRCVEVCPNRANMFIPVAAAGAGLAQSLQILHVDALCNECGNCGVFCPYEGEPYRHKPTLFADQAAMSASRNAGFAFESAGPGAKAAGTAVLHAGLTGRVFLRREYEGPVETLDAASLDRADSAMAMLARTVRDKHGYMLGGGL
ncbi:MAG TPA: putative selenate reductase subunit YgfK [Rectinemataceae bacterium]|nr:putative selenate reductase subunit YgfK [Rectinemataceae bacterium]